jgi:3',5'-cyclic-AMP phosphodiesterase
MLVSAVLVMGVSSVAVSSWLATSGPCGLFRAPDRRDRIASAAVRLTSAKLEPITSLTYHHARRGGGSQAARLPVHRLRVDELPADCDAVILTSDLQGIAPSPYGGPPVLLGIAVADYLAVWAADGLLPAPDRCQVLLGGDLYSAPHANQRGADGPVGDVWLAFAAGGSPSVLGVTGNHDELTAADIASCGPGAAVLDGDWRDVGGVRIAGVSGIIGDPGRLGRRPEAVQLAALRAALAGDPDLLILHEGPPGVRPEQRGSLAVEQRLRERPPPLTVCGHMNWPMPVSVLTGATVAGATPYIVNVDSRMIVLTR